MVLFWLLFRIGVRTSSYFWSTQPVFHKYNLWYKICPPGIITHSLPEKSKWFNGINIKTCKYSNLNTSDFTSIVNLLNKHYYKTDYVHFNPTKQDIDAYFSKDANSYIGLYVNNEHLFEHKDSGMNIIENDEIIGLFASRKINILLNGNFIPTHYVDYLCVSNEHRNKQIVPQLVETCYRHLRLDNKYIAACLFKRENKLMNWLVPFTQYKSYGFNLDNFKFLPPISSNIALVCIGDKNYNIIHNYISIIRKQYACFIQSDLGVIIELLKKSQLFIYILIHNHTPLSIYVFKDGNTLYDNSKSIECISSHYTCNSIVLFMNGFYHAINKLKKDYGYLIIENVSQNDKIINSIQLQYFPNMSTDMAYYFYNFAIKSVKSNNVFLMF